MHHGSTHAQTILDGARETGTGDNQATENRSGVRVTACRATETSAATDRSPINGATHARSIGA